MIAQQAVLDLHCFAAQVHVAGVKCKEMIRIIEKLVDYYIGRSITNKIIMLFIGSGIFLVGQSVLGQILETYLLREFGVEVQSIELWGVGFIALGLFMLILDIKYKLVPSVFATVKNTRIIYLGNNKYQFVFDKKMRVVPTISFEKPGYNENKCIISNWSEKGFMVQFEENKTLDEIQFWADAWQGLSFIQRGLLTILNLFRRKDNKIKKTDYESSFSKIQIYKINNT